MKKSFIATAILSLCITATFAQSTPSPKPAYWDDVQVIKKYDGMFAAPKNPLLFVGSSSIRKWDDAQWAFAPYNALNRGIGGAETNDIIYWLNDLVFKYKPKQLVIYVGENDMVDGKAPATADTVYSRTMKLYAGIRAQLPTVPIIYIGMKPSPSRVKIMPEELKFNQMMKDFIAKEKNIVFVDVYPLMLDNGKLRPELYLGDNLHMKQLGYDIWEKAIRPYLIK
ncbi:GDSL-type esterase/lipase family protein [Mucilaginibacter sp. dw_454]|uniref:GDSL-type esterase/lipase family protein n=1 Tax=Mucilaginibacter sp. dw_454 TaxID=2720079 RepID=UPI001BD1FD61|nr:GDSL-type esterase/lipase family protein [Mucilaginibacter sp. dw_454]